MIILASWTQGESQPPGSNNFAMSDKISRFVYEDFSAKGLAEKFVHSTEYRESLQHYNRVIDNLKIDQRLSFYCSMSIFGVQGQLTYILI